MSTTRHIEIEVPVLARVEGEGALDLHIREGRIDQLQLRIFEPPRYFEKFLEGRPYTELPDAVARICGICPVAYQMTAVQAVEQAFGCTPGPWVRAMRRLMYCGEWIQSHALHIHLLAAPDFFGCDSALELAEREREAVLRGLDLQTLGNDIISLLGARSVHPVGVCAGGFHRAPDRDAVKRLAERVDAALPQAEALIAWCAGLDRPEEPQDFISVALRHEREYAVLDGVIAGDHGMELAAADFETRFEESQRAHSTALYCRLDDQPYLVGPLARLNLNHTRLHPRTRDSLWRAGLRLPADNLFHSMLARAIEIHEVLLTAAELLSAYEPPERPCEPVTPRAGVGFGATEAPRGLLWQRYDFAADGTIQRARIVPPTSQNQARIEADLHQAITRFGLDQTDEALRLRAEAVIRNYDPCISCATHFLRLNVQRGVG